MDYSEAVVLFFADPPAGTPTLAVVNAGSPARRLRDALEPLSMHAVWSPGTNAALAELGFDFFGGYLTGRAAPLGDVPSSIVAATFAVFEPNVVDALWTDGRSKLPLSRLIEVRDRATTGSLRAVIAPVAGEAEVLGVAEVLERAVAAVDGTGRVLFSALRSQPRLADPYGRLWRAADLVREHRGDGHVAACVAAGLDPVRMGILMEVWLGYPLGEYSATRAWPPEAATAALARLEADGLVAGGVITEAGRAFRDAIEDATDRSQQTLVDALGPDLDAVAKQLDAWSERCIEARTFPPDPRKRAAG